MWAAAATVICFAQAAPIAMPVAWAAASITNREAATVTIKIVAGDKRIEEELKTLQRLDGICEDGCIVELVGREDGRYVLEGNEDVSIEDGFLYYDGVAKTKGAPPKE